MCFCFLSLCSSVICFTINLCFQFKTLLLSFLLFLSLLFLLLLSFSSHMSLLNHIYFWSGQRFPHFYSLSSCFSPCLFLWPSLLLFSSRLFFPLAFSLYSLLYTYTITSHILHGSAYCIFKRNWKHYLSILFIIMLIYFCKTADVFLCLVVRKTRRVNEEVEDAKSNDFMELIIQKKKISSDPSE